MISEYSPCASLLTAFISCHVIDVQLGIFSLCSALHCPVPTSVENVQLLMHSHDVNAQLAGQLRGRGGWMGDPG